MMEMFDKSGLMTAICAHCALHGECEIGHCGLTDVINRIETVEAEPVRHGHWTYEHKCSSCGGEVFSEITNIRPEYDYDYNENIVWTGNYEYDTEYYETDFCPFCGAVMDEKSE